MNEIIRAYPLLFSLYIFIFGICIGSFLNVVILRRLKEEDIVFTPSKCPKCNKQLAWYMNIPLFSYIFLKGRCAYCKEKISLQYPFIELITGLGFLYCFLNNGFNFNSIFLATFFCFFILLCATDYKEKVIIDYHAYILATIGFIYSFTNYSSIVPLDSILGGVAGYLIFEILSKMSLNFFKLRIFGEGDNLIGLALGTIFGYKSIFLVIVLSLIIQTIIAIPFLFKKELEKGKILLSLSYLSIFLGLLILIILNFTNINLFYYKLLSLITLILFLFSLINIIIDIKKKLKNNLQNNNSNSNDFFIMPFGPALIYSAILCYIFYDYIVKFFKY